jgi:hypothetical protein
MIAIAHVAALPNLLQLMAPLLSLPATLAMLSYSLIKVAFRFFDIAAAGIVLVRAGWNCNPSDQGRSQDSGQNQLAKNLIR